MADLERGFSPLEHTGGYLPLEDYGLIGDGETAALSGRDGAVAWLCVPRIDSDPLFCAILDPAKGGAFRIAPNTPFESRQRYEDDTAVLATEMRTASGVVRITDALALASGADLTEDTYASRQELIRMVEVVEGEVELRMELQHRRPDLKLDLWTSRPVPPFPAVLNLGTGEPLFLILSWAGTPGRHRPVEAHRTLDHTRAAWRAWMRHFQYEGPHAPLVRRSAITLKLLDNFRTGAIVAAPTSSLPEAIGGVRNWDYRYAWIRDASFAVYALTRIGFRREAAGLLAWVLDCFERNHDRRVLYAVDGTEPPPERDDPDLAGYRDSRPVRWGNGAAGQAQNDLYGEVLDCAHQWARRHGEIDPPLWEKLRALVETARTCWRRPDCGIWEVRSGERPFTYSAALCHVALDRAARMAREHGLPADVDGWERDARSICEAILEEAWSEELGSFTQHLGGGWLDASLLALPIRRLIAASHPRMAATTNVIARELSAGRGLLYRYDPLRSPDGLPGRDNAFLLCSFWLVDNLAEQGRVQEAVDLYDSLCARAGALGLLPEEIEASSGAFRGNYPQGLSHVGLIASGLRLARRLGGGTRR